MVDEAGNHITPLAGASPNLDDDCEVEGTVRQIHKLQGVRLTFPPATPPCVCDQSVISLTVPPSQVEDLVEEDRRYISDDYKREVIETMSTQQLIDTIMINPTVHITPSYRDTGMTASYRCAIISSFEHGLIMTEGEVAGVARQSLEAQKNEGKMTASYSCGQAYMCLRLFGRIGQFWEF